MAKNLYRNISCLVTNSGLSAIGGVRPQEQHLGIIKNGAVAHCSKRGVVWAGKDSELPKEFKTKPWKQFSGKGLTAYPGLVDPHTHPVFSGDRAHEFSLRMAGAKYQEIADAGGGILSSMRATRSAKAKDLTEDLQKRLKAASRLGVRLMEAKSGYGLEEKAELRSLEAIEEANHSFGVELVATCLAAHAFPPEFREKRDAYVDSLIQSLFPKVHKRSLAAYVDVFCDEGYFSLAQTEKLVSAAHSLGFRTRLHGEELAYTGVAEKAAQWGSDSVDHLLKISEGGVKAMARSGTVGILLPATAFYLREPFAPARKMIDQGMVVALASDFNPGSSPTQSLPFVGTLAAVQMGMTVPEIIAALTWNGARSLRKEYEYGALVPGFKGGPIFAEGDHPAALFYRVAPESLAVPESFTR